MPPKEADYDPWEVLQVDLVGPYHIKKGRKKLTLWCITMIDPATGWFEVKEIGDRKAATVAAAFNDAWLTRYPCPKQIGFDNGGENKGLFAEMTANYGLERKATTNYNPQANGVVERIHAVLNDILRTFELENRELDEHRPWDEFLSAAAFAL